MHLKVFAQGRESLDVEMKWTMHLDFVGERGIDWIAMGRVDEEIAKEVDDGRQSGQQQKIAAAESGRVGRPDRSTDMHNMHRALGGRSVRSTERP